MPRQPQVAPRHLHRAEVEENAKTGAHDKKGVSPELFQQPMKLLDCAACRARDLRPWHPCLHLWRIVTNAHNRMIYTGSAPVRDVVLISQFPLGPPVPIELSATREIPRESWHTVCTLKDRPSRFSTADWIRRMIGRESERGRTETPRLHPYGPCTVCNQNQTVPSRQFGKGFRDEFLKERIKSRTKDRRASNRDNSRWSSSTAEPYHSGGI